MRPLALVLLALLLATPLASAHVGDFTGIFVAEADGLAVRLQTDSLVVKAQREILFNGTVLTNASGRREIVRDATVTIEATGPGEARPIVASTDDGFQVRVRFPAPGEWMLLARVGDELRRVAIHVYPASTVWMESSNLRSNYHYANMPVRENLYFLDDATNVVVPAQHAASGRLSRLVNDTPADAQDVVLQPGPMGAVVFEHDFASEGWYLLAVASEQHGVGFASLPEIKFHVQERFAGDAPPAQTPALGLIGALTAGATALALRRRE